MFYKKIALIDFGIFWRHFLKEEKVLFYNAISKELIVGAKRLDSKSKNKYDFYFIPFLKTIHDDIWKGMEGEGISFQYYVKITENETLFYYEGEEVAFTQDKSSFKPNTYEQKMPEYKEWEALFERTKDEIKKGTVKKVVLSQRMELVGEHEVDIVDVLKKLMKNNPEAFVFAHQKDGKVFLGATPEILVKKQGKHIMSYALAGTIAKNGLNDEAQGEKLLADPKNKYEHQIVVETIAEVMKNITNKVHVGKTELMNLKNLYHLKTEITTEDSTLNLNEWAKLLHPTPAMGGKPIEKAMEMIKKYEKHDRGIFAAPIGVMDEKGDGIFVVGIRSALIDRNKIYAYAGCGIVEQSHCKEEYEEIHNKLRTILESL